jgi:hypothetical protein
MAGIRRDNRGFMVAVIFKPGARLKSAVSETQIMVLRTAGSPIDLRCGGQPMIGLQEPAPDGLTLDAAFAEPCLTGKRYTDEAETMEFLCTKGGEGSLSADGVKLGVKQAKQLPSSD